MDPLAERYESWSTYQYVRNNPILRIDPDGMNDDEWNYTLNLAGENKLEKVSDQGGNSTQIVHLKWEVNGKVHDLETRTFQTTNDEYNVLSAVETGNYKYSSDWWQNASGRIDNVYPEAVLVGFAQAGVKTLSKQAISYADDVSKSIGSGSQYSVAYEMKLAGNSYPGVYRGSHFLEANNALSTTMAADTRFASSLADLGITIPRSPTGSILPKSPVNWVWHHDIGPGVMQLVPKSQHTVGSIFWNTLHPAGKGGFAIWGK